MRARAREWATGALFRRTVRPAVAASEPSCLRYADAVAAAAAAAEGARAFALLVLVPTANGFQPSRFRFEGTGEVEYSVGRALCWQRQPRREYHTAAGTITPDQARVSCASLCACCCLRRRLWSEF